MKIAVFDSYEKARNEAITYSKGASRHPGMKGVEYRVYCYSGKYHLWRGRSYKDFPESKYGYVFSTRV